MVDWIVSQQQQMVAHAFRAPAGSQADTKCWQREGMPSQLCSKPLAWQNLPEVSRSTELYVAGGQPEPSSPARAFSPPLCTSILREPMRTRTHGFLTSQASLNLQALFGSLPSVSVSLGDLFSYNLLISHPIVLPYIHVLCLFHSKVYWPIWHTLLSQWWKCLLSQETNGACWTLMCFVHKTDNMLPAHPGPTLQSTFSHSTFGWEGNMQKEGKKKIFITRYLFRQGL